MVEVFAKTFSFPADTTVRAMVDFLFAIVVPQLAYIAVIAGSLCLTIAAMVGCLLGSSACHAEHVLGSPSVQMVIFYGIVTMSTGIPMPALKALYLDIALVMLAT